jgi:hypothetical protein
LIIIQYRKLSVDLKKLEEMERKYPGKNK